ncbi:alpha-amylase family glycosyl hydrolase [Undibacterium sp. RuRC25W]|uniref:alpha-amylase family glycosyl hydrolase n=1 Tax=Undibacterium sp. RuRC25W TaxID=3413047 RepID=UPI003BF252B1
MDFKSLQHSCLQALSTTLPDSLQGIVAARFSTRSADLLASLESVYASAFDDPDAFHLWLQQLFSRLSETIRHRSPSLIALDLKREQHPDWFCDEHMLAYCAYVDRFGGDLQGVMRRIPHLKEMGVTYLHLLPFLKARAGENDGGFAVSAFDEVEPALGTMLDLEQLTQALRRAGISLCSDFILNHVADDHPWASAAQAGDSHYQDYFYHFPDRQLPDAYEANLGQVFPQVAPGNFSYNEAMKSWVWTTFYPYQWDLNYGNPAVFADMVIAMLELANRGVEVFRLDSTAFLWKRLGTNCMNQQETHILLKAIRHMIDIAAPGVLLKAEAIVPTADLPAYLGSPDGAHAECHMAYHSTLMAASWLSLAEQNTTLMQDVIRATPPLPPNTSWLTYVRCHDDIGWNVLRPEARLSSQDVQSRLAAVAQFFAGEGNSFARGASFQTSDPEAVHGSVGMAAALTGCDRFSNQDQTSAIDRLLLLYGLSLCFGGMPFIYMGDELAQENDVDYQLIPSQSLDSRWLHRPHWQEPLYVDRLDRTTNSGAMFAGLSQLLQARRTLPQLAAHQPRHLLSCAQPEVLAFVRGSDHHPVIFVGNFSDHVCYLKQEDLLTPSLRAHDWEDLLTQQMFSDQIAIAPWSQYWLVPSNATHRTMTS